MWGGKGVGGMWRGNRVGVEVGGRRLKGLKVECG